jgi:hypothetical protein
MQVLPLVPGDDPRDDVERDRGLRTFGGAIGAEGDAVAAIEEVDFLAGRGEALGRGAFQPARHARVVLANGALGPRAHLVECLSRHPAFRPLWNRNISNRRANEKLAALMEGLEEPDEAGRRDRQRQEGQAPD